MSDVTQILQKIESGDPSAADLLLPLVYDELRKLAAAHMAQERPGQTLQATALVHEAYLRLVAGDAIGNWNSRGHFFGAAAEAMRRILIDRARDRNRQKRSADRQPFDLDAIEVALDTPPDELMALDEVLVQLETEYPDCGALVNLMFFGGLSLSEAAAAIGIPRRSADRKWAFSRAWLHRSLSSEGPVRDLP